MTARLVLVCGLPGSGKTTHAGGVASTYGAVRLAPDEWIVALGADLHDETFRDRVEAALWDHARELLRLGQSVVLESGFWSRGERDAKRLAARELGAAVELHHLDVPLAERWRRIDARNATWPGDPITYEALASWDALFDRPAPDEAASFDAYVEPGRAD